MAWHIFKKDLVLLWPMVLLSALAQFGLNALMFASDQAPQLQYLLLAARLSVLVVFLVITLAIALNVHQDPIPGTRQDWLVRPIRRRDLLLAKFLFIVAAVHLPMFLADLAEAMAHGFGLGEAVEAALTRNLYLLIAVSLPAFGFAAMTRNTAQFIGVGVVYFIAITAATVLLSSVARIHGQEQATNPLAWTGVAWIEQAVSRAVLAIGAVAALLLLYFRRRLALAWSLFPVFALASATAVLLPWSWLFGAQAAASATNRPVTVAFAPDEPRYRPAPGESSDDYGVGAAQVQLRGRSAGDIDVETKIRRAQRDVTVFVPLRLQGLPAGALPWADRADVTLRSADGRVVFDGRGDELKAISNSEAYLAIRLPALVYEAAKDKPLKLEIDLSLTVLRPSPPVSAPALGGERPLAGFGRCATGRDSDGDDIELRCLMAGTAPSCVSAALELPASGRSNPQTLICDPNYAPFVSRSFPDAITRFEVEAPFRDRLALARYPVGGADLGEARLALVRYDAAGHLERRLQGSGIHLSGWTAQAAQPR